ncbi:translation initiation factor IF-1 [Elusimicrobiota bacterium]
MGLVNKKDTIELQGSVIKALPNTMFTVKLDTGGEILAHISGKMRVKYIRVLPGDRVILEVSKYDPSKGRIIYRLDKKI